MLAPYFNNKGETMIRVRNVDYESEGMKLHSDAILGDVTASLERQIFVAPFDCVVERVDVYNNENQAVTTSPVISLFQTLATATTLAANWTATLTAGARVRFTPSAGNSLTAGARLSVSFNISGSSNFSGAIVNVRYIPQKHRSVR